MEDNLYSEAVTALKAELAALRKITNEIVKCKKDYNYAQAQKKEYKFYSLTALNTNEQDKMVIRYEIAQLWWVKRRPEANLPSFDEIYPRCQKDHKPTQQRYKDRENNRGQIRVA